MTYKQEVFIGEYIKTGNATESAKKAGYSQKTAYSAGQRLLKNVEIQKAIQQRKKELREKCDLSISDVVGWLREIAEGGKQEGNRIRAMDMLMKHLGGYRQEIDFLDNLPLNEIDKIADKLITKLNDNV